MEEVLALTLETRRPIRHLALPLRGANLTAKIGLAGFAELAFFAFGGAAEGRREMSVAVPARACRGEAGGRGEVTCLASGTMCICEKRGGEMTIETL